MKVRCIGVLAMVAVAAVIATVSLIITDPFSKYYASSITPEQQQEERLGHIVISTLQLDGGTLDDFVALLNKYAADAGINRGKPVFVLWREGDPIPNGFRSLSPQGQEEQWPAAMSMIPGLTAENSQSTPRQTASTRFSLYLRDITLREAARYVSERADHSMEAFGDQILIAPEGALCASSITITKEFYIDDPQVIYTLSTAPSPGMRTDLRSFFEANGVLFLPDSSAFYDHTQRKVVVHLEKSEVDLVDAILNASTCRGPNTFDSAWERRKWRIHSLWTQVSDYFRSYGGTSPP